MSTRPQIDGTETTPPPALHLNTAPVVSALDGTVSP
jgi:hypothetical protein